MENTVKVQKKVDELNGGPKGPWIPGIGFHSFMSFEFGPTLNNSNFKNDEGYAVKIFINTETGETRAFAATSFYDRTVSK